LNIKIAKKNIFLNVIAKLSPQTSGLQKTPFIVLFQQ